MAQLGAQTPSVAIEIARPAGTSIFWTPTSERSVSRQPEKRALAPVRKRSTELPTRR